MCIYYLIIIIIRRQQHFGIRETQNFLEHSNERLYLKMLVWQIIFRSEARRNGGDGGGFSYCFYQ